MRLLNRSVRALSYVPLLWVAVFVSFVLRAWFALGRLPYPYQPDPKDLGFDFHMQLVHFGFLATVASILIFLALMLIQRRQSGQFDQVSLRIQLLGILVVGVIVFVDPGRFLEWFMD
jgi:hypothetical protein